MLAFIVNVIAIWRKILRFFGIYIIFKDNMDIEIEKAITVLGLNFQKFGCEKLFPIQKLLEGR